MEYEGRYRAAIGYKEAAAGKTAFKVDRYYYTDWLEADELPVHLDGLSLDAVYENFVLQIAGTALDSDESATLKESVEHQKQRTTGKADCGTGSQNQERKTTKEEI